MTADSLLQKEKRQLIGHVGRLFLTVLVTLMLSVVVVSCAGKTTRTQELLATDYMAMSNDDLQLYYYQLEDQIVADERKTSGGSVSFGVGTSRYGGGSRHGGGVGVSTGTGSRPVATDLRDRRNEVRLELQKRGITP